MKLNQTTELEFSKEEAAQLGAAYEIIDDCVCKILDHVNCNGSEDYWAINYDTNCPGYVTVKDLETAIKVLNLLSDDANGTNFIVEKKNW